MYHYIIVNIVCWLPTIVFYIVEVAGRHSSLLEIVSRASLYLTGFFNFLVFGMQDPHLKKAFLVVMYFFGCTKWCCCFSEDTLGNDGRNSLVGLKTKEVEKNVMFDGEISVNADTSKDKKNIYRYHKLSKEDKRSLYENRPDLDPKIPIERRKKHGGDVSKSSKITEPLLADNSSEQEHKESEIEESSHSFLEACAAAHGSDLENEGNNATEMKEGRSIDLERAASSPIFSTLLSVSVGTASGGSSNSHSQPGQNSGSSSNSHSVSTSESIFNSAIGDGDSSDDDEDDEDRELAAMRFTQHR